MKEITFEQVKNNKKTQAYIQMSDKYLETIGFTEHGLRHTESVGIKAGNVLEKLNYDKRQIELAKIAGFLHDIGNMVNREYHAHSGGLVALRILEDMEMDPKEIAIIVSAIGNHDERTGNAISAISAALILSDKSDVHRGRVRNDDLAKFDIHDRVNYAVTNSELVINKEEKIITLVLNIDEKICPLIEYFELFLSRMIMCRRASNFLNCEFKMIVNGTKIL